MARERQLRRVSCKLCGKAVGAAVIPGSDAVVEAIAGTPFAALAGLIPANFSEHLMQAVLFLCSDCITSNAIEVSHVSAQEIDYTRESVPQKEGA